MNKTKPQSESQVEAELAELRRRSAELIAEAAEIGRRIDELAKKACERGDDSDGQSITDTWTGP